MWIKRLFLIVSFALVLPGFFAFVACGPKEKSEQTIGYMPETHFPEKNEFTGPGRCLPCHEEAVESWKASQHAVANRLIDIDHDAVNFHPSVSISDSSYEPKTAGNALRIEGPGIKASPLGEAEGVIGVEPLIQYLKPAGGGRWQAHELAFDTNAEEWFNIYGDEGRQPGEWGHWSGQGMNWNSNCASCHMTVYQKNYDIDLDVYSSTWVAQGVSCLQCHANSEAHTIAAEKGEYMGADLQSHSPALAMENCATCHSRRGQLTADKFKAGDRFYDHFRLSLPDAPNVFFPDGQNQDENYVYSSFMLSRMGHAGVTCLDCHDSHSHDLILPASNNALCQRCHETGALSAPIINPVAHSHHPAGSTGNQCIECHMPLRTYMGRDPRRDHGFISPDPELSNEINSPDVCVNCHEDKPLQWLVEHADQWYDSPRRDERRKRARTLTLAYDLFAPYPTVAIIEEFESTDQAYWKATYLRMLAQSPEASQLTDWVQPYLTDEAPVLRAAAVQLLAAGEISSSQLMVFLQDTARMVRFEAIEVLAARGVFPAEGEADHAEYLTANADRPRVALQMAARAVSENDLEKARRYVKRAIGFDSVNPEVYFQGAIILDQGGRIEDAFDVLRSAPEVARSTGLIYYAEGLLWAERGDFEQSANRLLVGLEKDPSQDRWLYNLALAYTKLRNWPAAMDAINQAITLAPNNAAYRQLKYSIEQNLRQ
tara:strand:- start:311 stop:2449 length:2139 start_codon:yes stop_codon:yes gene_type:complete